MSHHVLLNFLFLEHWHTWVASSNWSLFYSFKKNQDFHFHHNLKLAEITQEYHEALMCSPRELGSHQQFLASVASFFSFIHTHLLLLSVSFNLEGKVPLNSPRIHCLRHMSMWGFPGGALRNKVCGESGRQDWTWTRREDLAGPSGSCQAWPSSQLLSGCKRARPQLIRGCTHPQEGPWP